MKRYFIAKIISIIILITGSVSLSYSEPAYPFPIKVVQPDGSVITIQMHGDEYANWATCGNRLVVLGVRRLLLLRRFNATGGKYLQKREFSPNVMAMPATNNGLSSSSVFMQARIKREKAARVDQRAISQGNRSIWLYLYNFPTRHFNLPVPQGFYGSAEPGWDSANSGTGSAWNYFSMIIQGVAV